MKTNLLILSIFFSFSIFGQTVTKEFFQIKTSEKNAKTIIFHKKSQDLNEIFLITASNVSSTDFTKCSWKVKLTIDDLKELYQGLSELNFATNSQIDYNNLSINVKRGKVRVSLFNSRCINEHSISYFQKSCNRKLSFSINTEQINSFVKIFDDKFLNTIAIK